MTEQEKALEEVEAFKWMTSKGYDRKASKDIAQILVKYKEEQLTIHSVLNCLPTKEDAKLVLENYNKKYADSHDKKINDAYNIGFRHCFHFINDWVKGIRQIV